MERMTPQEIIELVAETNEKMTSTTEEDQNIVTQNMITLRSWLESEDEYVNNLNSSLCDASNKISNLENRCNTYYRENTKLNEKSQKNEEKANMDKKLDAAFDTL